MQYACMRNPVGKRILVFLYLLACLLAFIQSWLIYKEHVQIVIVEQNQCFVVIKSPRQWSYFGFSFANIYLPLMLAGNNLSKKKYLSETENLYWKHN
ncbi:hypothetical protein T11_7194 [Trichinella zimbabwensis]|uniref:Uncharacterized protein n=1 Tax=Trichinella zimbabwensis TaxID=268475 RepID=A0A0V1HR13_9BILA|nr:hypothetical protein T11_7194 [Trichinella zimbabwensis]